MDGANPNNGVAGVTWLKTRNNVLSLLPFEITRGWLENSGVAQIEKGEENLETNKRKKKWRHCPSKTDQSKPSLYSFFFVRSFGYENRPNYSSNSRGKPDAQHPRALLLWPRRGRVNAPTSLPIQTSSIFFVPPRGCPVVQKGVNPITVVMSHLRSIIVTIPLLSVVVVMSP